MLKSLVYNATLCSSSWLKIKLTLSTRTLNWGWLSGSFPKWSIPKWSPPSWHNIRLTECANDRREAVKNSQIFIRLNCLLVHETMRHVRAFSGLRIINDEDNQTTFTQILWGGFSCINVHIILNFLQSCDAKTFRIDFRPFKCQN